MPCDQYNIIPVFLAGILHVAIVVAMVFTLDFSRSVHPAMPLSIKGTLVAEQEIRRPPSESDIAEERRIDAEERKLEEDIRKEKQRITRLKKRQQQEAKEKKRREEIELQRRRDEAKEKKRREEIELQRRRDEAERKRREDVERQRLENKRKRREVEEAERRRQFERELTEESQRLKAMNSGAGARYRYAVKQQIFRNWIPPASTVPGIECVIHVRQLPGGEVVSATIGQCNGDKAVERSIVAAVFKASPLPEPENPTLFDPDWRITFKP
jgi:colicin import membrane protein